MKSVTRFAVLLGAGLAVGASMGVAPAMASSATPTAVQVQQPRDRHDDDEVEGYYRSLRVCERIGRMGERRDRWEDYDCERVRWGENRGLWRLEVERRDWWDDDDRDHDDDRPWDNRR
jgi:hypothetical protein